MLTLRHPTDLFIIPVSSVPAYRDNSSPESFPYLFQNLYGETTGVWLILKWDFRAIMTSGLCPGEVRADI
jgi:hypothetical protein